MKWPEPLPGIFPTRESAEKAAATFELPGMKAGDIVYDEVTQSWALEIIDTKGARGWFTTDGKTVWHY